MAGDYEWEGDKAAPEAPVGLKTEYYIYFGQFGTSNHWAFAVENGCNFDGDVFSPCNIKLFSGATVAGDYPPYGTGIGVTYDDLNSESNYTGYLNEISTTHLEARTLYVPGSVYDIEVRYDFLNGPISEAILSNLDYLYIGTGVSNPSSPSDLFANDHFTQNGSTSAEYDTILIRIPEPSTAGMILLSLAMALGFTRSRPRGKR